jgi:methyl-galactoside transport system substrate-binding protein
MRKTLAVVLSMLMCVVLFGCGGGSNNDSEETKTYDVGVTIYQFDDNFMTLYRNDIKAYFDDLNAKDSTVQYNVTIVDAANDMATQTEQVNTFISQGVDVMIVNLVQTSSGETISKLAADANIPVVFINREIGGFTYPENQCYVGADARDSGTYQGQIIYNQENHGDINGNGVVDYIMIMGDPENSDAQFRTEYSIKYLTDNGVAVNCLYQETGNWAQDQGQTLAANALTQYGTDIDVIFCNNDAMALGAYQAIVAAGRTVGKDIYLVGVDALSECVQMVKDGTMTGTVLNDDQGQATACCETAIGLINGQQPEKTVNYVPYVMVTTENADQYLK